MSKNQTIAIRKDFDVIVARSRVRDLARSIGLGTTDQARISLAASSAARALGLGEACQGAIVIEAENGHERACVRVTCRTDSVQEGVTVATFSDARFMVDEITVQEGANGTQVTLVKCK
jgi:hypothetical protein